MYLIAGLGNPDRKYELTRHNAGFMVIDELARICRFPKFSSKFSSLISSGRIYDNTAMLLKPLAYMNNSGYPIAQVVNFYKLNLDRVIIVHDDVDIKFGVIKTKKSGGAAGHNGLKSIDQHIGQEYQRLRFGIGRPEDGSELSHYVLSNFSNVQELEEIISTAAQNVISLIK